MLACKMLPSLQHGDVEGCACEERSTHAHVPHTCQTEIGSGKNGWVAWQDIWKLGLEHLHDQDAYVLSMIEVFVRTAIVLLLIHKTTLPEPFRGGMLA